MCWMINYKYAGFTFTIAGVSGPEIGLCLNDAATVDAIRNKDPRLLDALGAVYDEAVQIVQYMDIADLCGKGDYYFRNYYFLPDGGQMTLQDRHDHMIELLGNKHIRGTDIEDMVLGEIENIERLIRNADTTRAKREHSQRRREQFSKDYDRLMLALIERDGFECAICGTRDDLTIDHIVPLSKGGGDDLDNLRLLCRKHNSQKGDKTVKLG